MSTTSFTTRLDAELKADLEQIARFEDRSAASLANEAIRAFVEERKATRALVDLGSDMVARGAKGVAAGAVHQWMEAEDDLPFPSELTRR